MTEMEKLIKLLVKNCIPHEILNDYSNMPQIWIPNRKEPIADIICNKYSYGNKYGLLEMWVYKTDEVTGYLNAENAFNLIKSIV